MTMTGYRPRRRHARSPGHRPSCDHFPGRPQTPGDVLSDSRSFEGDELGRQHPVVADQTEYPAIIFAGPSSVQPVGSVPITEVPEIRGNALGGNRRPGHLQLQAPGQGQGGVEILCEDVGCPLESPGLDRPPVFGQKVPVF